jgi:hypothetical protein
MANNIQVVPSQFPNCFADLTARQIENTSPISTPATPAPPPSRRYQLKTGPACAAGPITTRDV